MRVYRDNKFNHFVVYFDILFDKLNFKYFINDLIILVQIYRKILSLVNIKKTYILKIIHLNLDNYSLEEFLLSKKRKNI